MSNTMELIVSYEAQTADNQSLKTNFEDIKTQVIAQVEKYSIEVTEENIPEAKKVMANFNKVKAEIGERYKFYIDKLSAPINQLKDEKKSIEGIIADGRQKIADGVAGFEKAKLEEIEAKVKEYINSLCAEKEINPGLINSGEFVKLTAVTSAGSLAKTTKEAIEAKVGLIENEILKAKLEAEEKAKRDREIAEQAKREAEERAAKEKAELEAKAEREKAELLAKAEKEKAEAIERAKAEAVREEPKQAPEMTDDGKAIYTIRATFKVRANANAPHDKLTEKINEMLVKAGINNCVNLEVLNA